MNNVFEIPHPVNTELKLLYFNTFEWIDVASKHFFKGHPKAKGFYISDYDKDTNTFLIMLDRAEVNNPGNVRGITLDGNKMVANEEIGYSWKCNAEVLTTDKLVDLCLNGEVDKEAMAVIQAYCDIKRTPPSKKEEKTVDIPTLSSSKAAEQLGDIDDLVSKLKKLKSVSEPLFLAITALTRFSHSKFFSNNEDSMIESEIIYGNRLGKQGSGALMMKYLDDFLNLIPTPLPTGPVVLNLGYVVLLELAREVLQELEREKKQK